jgi:hypothetical protein
MSVNPTEGVPSGPAAAPPATTPDAGLSPLGTAPRKASVSGDLTVTSELLFAASGLPAVVSVALTVCDPAVFKVTVNVCLPLTSAKLAGKPAAPSIDLNATTGVAPGATTQFPSTAFTVTVNGVPAVSGVGLPVLPAIVFGAFVSPGSNICSRAAGFCIAKATGVLNPLANVVTTPAGVNRDTVPPLMLVT